MSARTGIADILCIGCQKGSTSWLHSVLACHPRTWSFPDSEPVTSTDKEAHFWDWNHHRGLDWYRTLMTPPDPARLSMDFTPEYAFLSEAQIAECKAVSPGARVVYVLRDPLARAVSALRMHLLWEHGKDWQGRLDIGPRLDRFARAARLAEHGDYTANIARWRRAYPDLTLLHYEDFHNDREAAVARLMSGLELDPGEMGHEARERLRGLMAIRIWQSEPFAVSRAALMFLEGLVAPWREAAARELDMRFDEGAKLIEAA